MRIFILAVDGLEYDLVKKWHLSNLKQEVFGWIDVSSFRKILTPILWASFITGKPPETHGVTSWWTLSSISWIDRLFHLVRYRSPVIKHIPDWRLRKMVEFLGLDIRPPQKSDLQERGLLTIFDCASRPVAIDVPSYSETADTRALYARAMEGGIMKYENEIWRVHKRRIEEIWDKLNLDWDLFMAWVDLCDQMGHMWMGKNMLKMLKAYTRIDRLAYRIKQVLPNDTLFVIVSDHGFGVSPDGYPCHSSRAFYSFNTDMGWRPEGILDYAGFVREVLLKKSA
ncbi:MAG: alkaline phosphatase family protein [Desulfobacterales bacterium]|nr:alkaline phosphatase family protein [Desulfobacterales bacterium]